MGYKTCKESMELRQHMKFWKMAWYMVWKNVYSLWVNCCNGTSFLFDLHWCILFNIAIFIILTNAYTLITVYFCVCRWKVKKNKTISTMNKTFLKITHVMKVALVVIAVQAKNDDHYVWISKQGVVFFEICLWNQTFCLM